MSARFAFGLLTIAALASVVMMWTGVTDHSFQATALAAAAFGALAMFIGWHTANGPTDDAGGGLTVLRLHALRRSGHVSALVYAWGAAALFAMYKLTGLYWQHGLQYAAAMLLFAIVIFGWTHLARPGGALATPQWLARATRLNLVHGSAAALATAIFLVSGKLWADRPDWAANIVFLTGGICITALCAIAALTQLRLARA